MPCYVPIPNTGESVPGWPKGTVRYFIYPLDMTCAQGEAEFKKFKTLAEQIANTTDVLPGAGPSQRWVPRSCSADVITDVEILDPDDTGGSAPAGGRVVGSGTATYNGQPVSYLTIDTSS